jgi:hypothetical protein
MPGREVVEYGDLVAGPQQNAADVAAEEAGPTGEKDAHYTGMVACV